MAYGKLAQAVAGAMPSMCVNADCSLARTNCRLSLRNCTKLHAYARMGLAATVRIVL